MKIKAQAILVNPYDKKAQEQIPVKDLEKPKVQPLTNKLQHLFEVEEKGPGERIRIQTKKGNLYDVYLMPDGRHILIQELLVKVQYGKQQNYPSWDHALKALMTEGDFEMYAAASTKRKKVKSGNNKKGIQVDRD